MKNIFRILGAALIASTMLFVSCGKDEDEKELEQMEDATINVQLGDVSWDAGFCNTLIYSNGLAVLASKSTTGEGYPWVKVFIGGSEEGTYTGDFYQDQEGNYRAYSDSAHMSYAMYYENSLLADSVYNNTGYEDGNWWDQSISVNITDFDADTREGSMKITATMFDYLDWYVNYNDSPATKEMTIKVNKVPFTIPDAKGTMNQEMKVRK